MKDPLDEIESLLEKAQRKLLKLFEEETFMRSVGRYEKEMAIQLNELVSIFLVMLMVEKRNGK